MITPANEKIEFVKGTTYTSKVRAYSNDKTFVKIVEISTGVPTTITLEEEVPPNWTLWFVDVSISNGDCKPAFGSLESTQIGSSSGASFCCEDQIGEHNQLEYRIVEDRVIEVDIPSSSIPVDSGAGYVVFYQPLDISNSTFEFEMTDIVGSEDKIVLDSSDFTVEDSTINFKIRPELTENLPTFSALKGVLIMIDENDDRWPILCADIRFIC